MSEETDIEEERREVRRRRSAQPRLGSFVTIAVAILLLFGAASRMGKSPETAALFNIDLSAGNQLREERNRLKSEEERLRTFLTIGAAPVQQPTVAPEKTSPMMSAAPEPPYRGEFDIEEQRRLNRTAVSMPVPDAREQESPVRPPTEAIHNPAPEAAPQPHSRTDSYVVAAGDTWVKIAKNTLGDSKRWQDIQKANPDAQNGLRVGMRLVIPK